MRDREKIKELFVAGDQYIENHPEVVKMTTDEIFHRLNDGTEEMIHLRWAVMVRVSMKQLDKFDYETVIEYLCKRQVLSSKKWQLISTTKNHKKLN